MNEIKEVKEKADKGELIQYIVIKIDDEQYGINIKFIDNIVRMQQITRVPKVDAFLKLLEGYEILELARTGVTGLTRGSDDVVIL